MDLVCRILLLLNCLFTLLVGVLVFTSSGVGQCEILTTQRQKFVGKVKNPRLWNKSWRDCGLGAQVQLQHTKSNVE